LVGRPLPRSRLACAHAGLSGALVFGGWRQIGHEFRQLLAATRERGWATTFRVRVMAPTRTMTSRRMDVAAGLGLEFADQDLAGAARRRATARVLKTRTLQSIYRAEDIHGGL